MTIKKIKAIMDDNELNKLNYNFEYLSESHRRIQTQINDLVLDAGESNQEVVQARGGHLVLNDRLNSIDSKLAQKANENEVVKKGGVTRQDFDVSADYKLLDLNNFNEKTRSILQGLEPGEINAVLGRENVKRENVAKGAIAPENTTFMERTKNLFNGEYHNINLERTGNVGNYYFFMTKPNPNEPGRTGIIEIKPNTTYTVTIHDTDLSDVLRIATHHKLPEDDDYNVNDKYLIGYITQQGPHGLKTYTFTSDEEARYMLVQTSTEGKEPRLQVEEGDISTEYETPFYIKSIYIPKSLLTPQEKNIFEELRGNIYQRNYRVDKLFKSADAVVVGGDVTLSDVSDTTYQKNNTSAVKLTVNSPEDEVFIDFPLNSPIDMRHRTFGINFYLPPETSRTPRQAKFNAFSVYLQTPNGWFVTYPDSGTGGSRRYPGWNMFIGRPGISDNSDEIIAALDEVTAIRIFISVDTSITEPYDIYIDSLISWDSVNKPTVLLEFDDALRSVYDNAFPLMAERGMRGATHVITRNIANPSSNVIKKNELMRMHDVGWDICSHTVEHPFLSEIPLDEAKYELEQSQKDLLNAGFKNGPQFFVAPYGDNSIEVVEHARKIYANYRMTGYRVGQPAIPPIPYAMECINAGSRGLDGLTPIIDRTARFGGHLPLMWHGEIGETWGGNKWEIGEFKDLLDYLIEKGFHVVTYSDMFPGTRIT